jgi:hypothetical protein
MRGPSPVFCTSTHRREHIVHGGEVHQSISLLNPSADVIIDWQVGFFVTALAPKSEIVAKLEVCHD